MGEDSPKSSVREPSLQSEADRCRAAIAEIEALLRAGHAEVHGLCRALADWSAELRMIEERERKQASKFRNVTNLLR